MATALALALITAQQLTYAGIAPDSSAARGTAGVATATRVEAGAIRIDGRIDEAAWSGARMLQGWAARQPVWGAAPSEQTDVRVVYDADALYVAFRAHDRQAGRIDRQLMRRDAGTVADHVGVSVDPNRDRRTAYNFLVTAAGVQRDVYRFNDTEMDETWNAVWESAVSIDSTGWSAEIRIPFSQLRIPAAERHHFGFNVFRGITRTGEALWWKAPAVGENGFVSTYGDLEGIEGVRAPKPIEVQPYLLAGANRPVSDPGNPFAQSGLARSAGADLRVGLTSSLTLTAAFNPDFGQVEADPAVLNVSASETFLPERRPFFAEGADLFRLSLPAQIWSSEQLFYSRRIGRAPQGEADARGGFAETISNTNILGAGKLTGRLAPGWTVGALAAVTQQEQAAVVDGAGVRYRDVVEPRTLYGMGRLARELRGGQTVLGLFGTLAARDLPATMSDLRSRGYTAGTSLEHRFARDAWHVNAQAIASRVEGSAEAITETQRSSVHYFQRPDDHVALDSTRTSLDGAAFMLDAGKHAGTWVGGLRLALRSPGFEVNDLGFQTWAGQQYGRVHLARRWLRAGKVFNSFTLMGGYNDTRDWRGIPIQRAAELTATWLSRGNWWGESSVWYRLGGRDPMTLRGGPALHLPKNWFMRHGVETDGRRRAWVGVYGGAWGYPDEPDFQGQWGSMTVVWRPSSAVELRVTPRAEQWNDTRAYFATGTTSGSEVYVTGKRSMAVAALGLRANATLSTKLSLEAFAEPFVSRGRTSAFRVVADPHARSEQARFTTLDADQVIRSGDLYSTDLDRDGVAEFEIGEPDFTNLSLRSNVVLRWEYRSPSTIFVVWQQGREEGLSRAISMMDGARRIGSISGANRLLVKVTYWLRVR